MPNSKVHESIAIIGISFKLPKGCDNLTALWNLLVQQQHTIRKLQEGERWTWPGQIDTHEQHRGIDCGGFLENISHFDAEFFKISPKEAKLMDPQQRFLLELSWQCLEDAGYNPNHLSGSKTGVYIGSSHVDYHTLLLNSPNESGGYLSTGSGHFALANRLSHFFNFNGPSLVTDTASSSSLVALNQAVEALQNNQCEQALVGGINLICSPDNSMAYYQAGMLSPDAQCRSFDSQANGYVRGEGGIVLLLKPLKKACQEGDSIYGVIRGQAINHSGQTRSITVPSAQAQAALLKAAYSQVDFEPSSVTYIETHGSGTPVGDPIEIEGLIQGFKALLSPQAFSQWRCGLGSVKSNVGHLEAASGLMGVLKVILALHFKELPATLNHDQPNPAIALENTPFRIITAHEPWISVNQSEPLRAGVSSFGLGGVNAHVILEEYQSPPITNEHRPNNFLFIFSAKNKQALQAIVEKFIRYLPNLSDNQLNDLAYTLQVGRLAMEERLAVIAANIDELRQHLIAYQEGKAANSYSTGLVKSSKIRQELILEQAITKLNLNDLAQFWLKGHTIDWPQLYQGDLPQRLHLPTYSFLKQDYWIEVKKEDITPLNDKASSNDTLTQLQDSVRLMMAKILQLPSEKIEDDLEMNDLGFDSLSFREFSYQLNEKFAIQLTPAIFFELHTLKALSQYLLQELTSVEKSHLNSVNLEKPSAYQDIAIIGVAAEFPKSENIEQFWQHLVANHDLIDVFPQERWGQKLFHDVHEPTIKFGGFIANIDEFDAEFFKISPFEAELMDPQQRRFMQIVWQALADAGMNAEQLSDSNTGLFVGIMNSDYQNLLIANNRPIHAYTSIGLAHSMLANRLSFLLNLQGPSEAIDTACSSSLVALHRAVTALQNGECEMAIAGGVNLILSPNQSLAFNQAGMLSPDGRCKTFDKTANGYVRAEGVAALLLKPLEKAIKDSNFIHGVIKGSVVNHGGRAASLTAPNANAQADLLIKAYSQAGIDPTQVNYIETHGTGTSLGDPVEINGLKKAFSHLYAQWGYTSCSQKHCALGSVKTNMGHAEATAGLAGVIKVLLAMKHQCLPSLLHYQELNPYIDLTNSPFYLCVKNQQWPSTHQPRYAGVSSFGFGGVNAHVILADYPNNVSAKPNPAYQFARNRYWFLPLEQETTKTTSQVCEPTLVIKESIWQTSLAQSKLQLAAKPIVILIEPHRLVDQVSFFKEQGIECIGFVSNHLTLAKRYQDYALQLLAFCQNRIVNYPNTAIRLQVIIPWAEEAQTYLGLAALLKTAELENPLFSNQLIAIDAKQSASDLLQLLLANSQDAELEVKYQQNQRYVRTWQLKDASQTVLPWKSQGIYLITGGMGELGFNLAAEIVKQVDKPTLILVSRSALTAEIQSKIHTLQQAGAVVDYYSIPVDNALKIEALIHGILLHHGELNGIIHAAGIIQDQFILHKKPEELMNVFAPKVAGLEALDKATKHISLDFFVTFSSFISVFGNVGQADYAAANAFMDAYMTYRQELVVKGQRQGKSISINWPLWQEGGMAMNAEIIASFKQRTGIVPLSTTQGMQALYQVMSQDKGQFLIMPTAQEQTTAAIKLSKILLPVTCSRDSAIGAQSKIPGSLGQAEGSGQDAPQPNCADLKTAVFKQLQQLFSRFIKIPAEKITADTLFRDYGIDSIMVIQLNKEFELLFGEISKTLLYEYQTLADLIDYLINHYTVHCQQWVGLNLEAMTPPITQQALKTNLVTQSSDNQPIAIIGLAGRYPDAHDIHQFWQNLKKGKDSIKEIPSERWNWQDYYINEPDAVAKQNKSYSKWGGFIDDFAEFDSLFFHISRREALNIDPQERLFLQCAWETFEDAGYTRKKLKEYKVGVFAGITKTGFEDHRSDEGLSQGFNPRTSFSSVANRISYFFNFNGPSLSIDTMCSSSLVAIHLACQQLQSGQCDLALAGGVNLYLHPSTFVFLSQMQMLSKDGKNCSFGAQASGFVPGEGVGIVLLKRLADAERDGDHIYAVIGGSAVNHGGLTSGYTVPNVVAQRELVKEAIEQAGINASSISYVEAHGTGTVLGDPIEVAGLSQAFEPNAANKPYCALGSVKSNIGHCEAAAGIAGLTKLLLQLKYRQLVPSLHAKEVNPNINFAKTPFYVQQDLSDWALPKDATHRIAGLSSFGAGGTNAHLIVKEYIKPNCVNEIAHQPMIISWSSHFADGLKQFAHKLHQFLVRELDEPNHELSLINIAYTLSHGREAFPFRTAIIAATMDDLLDKLTQYIKQNMPDEDNFIFSGSVQNGQLTQSDAFLLSNDKDLSQLAQAWVRGSLIDWSLLFKGQQVKLISLPTSVFAAQKIWFEPKPKVETALIQPIIATGNPMEMSNPNKKTIVLSDLSQSSTAEPSPVTETVAFAMGSTVKQQLISQLADLLFLKEHEIKEDEAFVNLGLDSIIGVEWVKKISQSFKIKISATKLYDYPTIHDLTQFLITQLQPEPSAPKSKPAIQLAPIEAIVPVKNEQVEAIVEQEKLAEHSLLPDFQPVVSHKPDNHGKIAIIGLSGRFPGANNIHEFWQNLVSGVDSVIEVPSNRWQVEHYYDPNPKANYKVYSDRLGAVANIDEFDPLFFNLSPLEAECMDPQQRLFLQEAWRAFEDAGYSPKHIEGKKCGTYVGVMQNDYGQMLYEHEHYRSLAQTAMGNSSAIFAARIAYFLNLKGPAIAIDTACSSSLVATHLACQALINREVDMALVGGATLYIGVGGYQRMCDAGMLSPTGKCFSFDNRADGFVPGEAVVAVLLKRLEDAIDDGDHIYGVILGSGINQDGKTNGITAPSVNSQIELQQDIYQRFSINPDSISYIETHGTGTKLGDPIEMDALTTVYNKAHCKKQSCAIGSVKSNLGHTSAAAGLVSLQKILLCLQHKKLVPSLHFKEPNEHIDFENSPFYVNTEVKDWLSPNQPRRAAINSFGFSGTNAHLVVEEYLPSEPSYTDFNEQLVMVPLSAKKPAQLQAIVQQLHLFLSRNPFVNLSDLAYTLQVGRQAMTHRVVFLVKNTADLIAKLNAFLTQEQPIEYVIQGQVNKTKQTLHSLYADDDFQAGLQQWIVKGKLLQLATVWVEGIEFDWTLSYKNNRPKKIALPTYPFAGEKYWFNAVSEKSVSTPLVQKTNQYQPLAKNTLLATQQWVDAPLVTKEKAPNTLFLLIDLPNELINLVKHHSNKVHIFTSNSVSSIAEKAIALFKQVLMTIQQVLEAKLTAPTLVLIAVPNSTEDYVYAPLLGLLKTAAQENSKLIGKLVHVEVNTSQLMFNYLLEEENDLTDKHVRYLSNQERQVQQLVELDIKEDNKLGIKEGGVYWLIGGLGGLGQLLSQAFSQTNNIKLILSGRSSLTPETQNVIKHLNRTKPIVEYIQVDITNQNEVYTVVDTIKHRYGQINGIIHAAGLIQDAFIQKKTQQEIEAVLRPKIQGLMNIDKAVQHEKIDFFVLFSSIAAIIGNIGQADYSGANAFLDAFAVYRNQQVEAGLRFGKTLSMNWPLWQEGGMQIDKESEAWFERRTGIEALTSEQGIALFINALNYPVSQVVITQGDIAKIRHYLAIKTPVITKLSAVVTADVSIDAVHDELMDLCGDLLKITKADMDLDSDFSEYGLDSILMMSLLNKLEEKYQLVVDASVLIDYPTIRQLANYLANKKGVSRVSQPTPRITTSTSPKPSSRKIAIIGQACRLPQSASLEEFWDNLANERELITKPPADRWDSRQFSHFEREGLDNAYLGGYLKDIADFDAAYFGIKEEEAAAIEPQHRLMLELAQELFDRAGYSRGRLDGSNTGLFIGAKENNYVRNNYQYIPEEFLKHTIVNFIGNMMAARVSDFYNLTGVAKTIDTACSSSLVAIHDACQSILNGESDMAVAGGIFLLVDPFAHIGFNQAKVLSPESKSYVFDERANGFVLAEGAGLVLLKEYDAAIRDGDSILGVILGSAVNNDGKTMGLTVPNQEGQKRVIAQALAKSQIDPSLISYYEAHGTGTLLGDPIEIKAATQVYRQFTHEQQYCALGSVKSNIGHTMTAAGVASLIKVLLSMQHKKIPATLNCSKPHPRFQFHDSPFYPNTSLRDWLPRQGRRIAAISSLGFGGTNCHMILEEIRS